MGGSRPPPLPAASVGRSRANGNTGSAPSQPPPQIVVSDESTAVPNENTSAGGDVVGLTEVIPELLVDDTTNPAKHSPRVPQRLPQINCPPLKTISGRCSENARHTGSISTETTGSIASTKTTVSRHTMDRISVSSPRPSGRYPRASRLLVTSGWMAFVSSLVLLIAYAAPYWLESYAETRSETQFVRLGLWEVCFNRYVHPPYQYDEVFDGCHWIHGYYFQNIRDWLMPGWFMFTQAMLTLSLMFELTALIVLSVLLMRYLLRYEIVVLTAAFVLEALTALLLFLGVSVFGGMAFSRYWLLYPNFNHLSWGYAFAVVAMFFHAFTACIILKEAFNSKERRRRDNNLVYNMQPRGDALRY